MRVGVTGTRHGFTKDQEASFTEEVKGFTHFLHGSCGGVDVEAARIVRKMMGKKVHIICLPGPDGDSWREISGVDDEIRAGKTHFARNRDIVNECDLLIGCPYDAEEMSHGGTWYTINYARKKGKKLIIIWPNGDITRSVE